MVTDIACYQPVRIPDYDPSLFMRWFQERQDEGGAVGGTGGGGIGNVASIAGISGAAGGDGGGGARGGGALMR
eukprot:11149791-Ditylum_brightwellii.AAC.1